MRYFTICIIILLIFFRMGIMAEHEAIAYGEKNKIVFYNTDGSYLKTIILPLEIEYSFRINGDVVCFSGIDKNLHWYYLKLKKERPIKKGPYAYQRKSVYDRTTYFMGPEIYGDIDIAINQDLVVFVTRPEYYYERNDEFNEESPKKYYPDLDELSVVIAFDIKSNQIFRLNEDSGFNSNPIIYEDKIIIEYSSALITVWDRSSGNELFLNTLFDKYIDANEMDFLLKQLRVVGDELIFVSYHPCKDRSEIERPLKLYAYNLKTNTFDGLFDLGPNKEIQRHSVQDIVDCSTNKDRLLILCKGNELYLADLNTKKMKLVLKKSSKLIDPQFCFSPVAR